jgi:hypothetical protein
MILNMRVQISSQTKLAREWGAGFADEFAYRIAQEGAVLARARTKPGIGTSGLLGGGPGPHPHRTPHYDTGELSKSIVVERRTFGFLATATISTHLAHGLYLEKGWHAANGAFYRYPWLQPSVDLARQRAEPIAKTTARRWFGDSAFSARGVIF